MNKFSEVLDEIERARGEIGPRIPKANWRYVSAYLTPKQLRIIADQIEEDFNGDTDGDNN